MRGGTSGAARPRHETFPHTRAVGGPVFGSGMQASAASRRTGRPAAIEPRVPLLVPLSETMSVPAETRYARSGEVSIAYQVTGARSRDLVYVPGVSQHVELNWENPPVSRFLERLGSLGRVIVFDKRATGVSDRVTGSPTLDARMDDIRAVMDATDSEQAELFRARD